MDVQKKEAQRKFVEKVGKEGLPEGAGDKGVVSRAYDAFMGRSDPGASSSSAGRRPEEIQRDLDVATANYKAAGRDKDADGVVSQYRLMQRLKEEMKSLYNYISNHSYIKRRFW